MDRYGQRIDTMAAWFTMNGYGRRVDYQLRGQELLAQAAQDRLARQLHPHVTVRHRLGQRLVAIGLALMERTPDALSVPGSHPAVHQG